MLLAGALSNRQIADRLVLSERTVESHVRNILAKTGCANRTEFVARGRDSTVDTGDPAWYTSIAVADRDAGAARVEELGGTILSSMDTAWTREAEIADPQGARFAVEPVRAAGLIRPAPTRVSAPACPGRRSATGGSAAVARWPPVPRGRRPRCATRSSGSDSPSARGSVVGPTNRMSTLVWLMTARCNTTLSPVRSTGWRGRAGTVWRQTRTSAT